MSDLRSSSVDFRARKNIYDNTNSEKANDDITANDLSVKVATALAKHFFTIIRDKKNTTGYQHILDKINTIKDNILSHGAHKNSNNSYEAIAYQLTHLLSNLSQDSVKLFLRFELPLLLQNFNSSNLSNLVESNTEDAQMANKLIQEATNRINILKSEEMQPKIIENKQEYAMTESSSDTLESRSLDADNNVTTADDSAKKTLKKQQKELVNTIKQELSKYHNIVSIYAVLQRVKDKLSYSYSYNTGSASSKLNGLIIVPNISDDDFTAIVNYFSAISPGLIDNLKRLHTLGQSANRQLLNTIISSITSEQDNIQTQENTLVKDLGENNVNLSNIHNQLTAKGLADEIVNLPPNTEIPTTASDTLKKQQQHDFILQHKNKYTVAINKLEELNEVLAILTSLQELQESGNDIARHYDITSKLTELQKQLLQEQGIDIDSLATNLNTVISTVANLVSTLNSNANNAINQLKNASIISSTVKKTTIKTLLNKAQDSSINKVETHDGNIITLLEDKIRKFNIILALVRSKKEDEDLANQKHLGFMNKHIPLTGDDLALLTELNGGEQSDVISNLTQAKDYNSFNEAVKVVNQIQNKLSVEYRMEYASRIQQHKSLLNIQKSLTENGFGHDIYLVANSDKQYYIDKLHTETEILQKTQKIITELDEKQKLAAFVAILTAAKNENRAFNLNFLNSETLFLLKKYDVISESNYFTDAAANNGKSDFDLVKQNDNKLQKDTSYEHGEIKFDTNNYQQLIDKITSVINKTQSDETADLSTLTKKIKQSVVNNLLSVLRSKQATLGKSTKKTSAVLDSTLEASGAITEALTQSTDPATASGAFHKFTNDIHHPQLIAVHVKSSLSHKLEASYFSKEAEQLHTSQNNSSLQAIQAAITGYKHSLIAQQNRYYYNLLQTNDELAAIKQYLDKPPSVAKKSSGHKALSLYTNTLYDQKKSSYVTYAAHKDKLDSIKKVSDALYYFNKLKGDLISHNKDRVVVDPRYLPPEIMFLLSTIDGFRSGNNFLHNTNPDDIPDSLRNITWTDFNLLAYNSMKPPVSKKLLLEGKKFTAEQLDNLIKAVIQVKNKIVNQSFADVKKITNTNIATVALKEHMFQLQHNIIHNQDSRKKIIEEIHHLQRLMWKLFKKIDDVDEDSSSLFSETQVADKLGLKVKLDLLSKKDIQWLSSAIGSKVIEKAMKSHKLADLKVLKQKINEFWKKLHSLQKGLRASIEDANNNEYQPIIHLVENNPKFKSQGIIVEIDTTNTYSDKNQVADLKTQTPYDLAKKYSQIIFRLKVLNDWLRNKTRDKNDGDIVRFSPGQLSLELFKDLSFKNNDINQSILEKAGFSLDTTRFLEEPTTMADGSELNADLYPDDASTKGMQRDFYFVTNNKLHTDYNKKFSLIGAHWKISDLKRLSSSIKDAIKKLNTLEGNKITELQNAHDVLLQPSLKKKSLILEYSYLVNKLNKTVNKIDSLNNEKSSFAAIKSKISKLYHDYELHKDNPYNKYIEIPSIKLGLAKIIMASLELNKKYLADHGITNLPTKAEDIVKLNTLPNKDKVLTDLYKAANLLANKNLLHIKKLIDSQDEIIEAIAKISKQLREAGEYEYGYGPVSLTGGNFAIAVFRQQYTNATTSRARNNEKANRYLEDSKLFNRFHQIITAMLPLYFKDTKVTSDGFSSKPRQLPVDKILALKTPRIADMLHSFLTVVSETDVAKNQSIKVLPKGKNLFKMPTHLRSGRKIDSALQHRLDARIKKNNGNVDYSLIAYNLDHPDNPLVLETEEFTREEAQAISGNLGNIEKTLGDQAQLQLGKVQQDELHINNAVEVQIQFLKSYNKVCQRLLAVIN
jgi:biotin operon repressor